VRLDQRIEDRQGVTWITNPTDPRENFADKWAAAPEKRDAFYQWLEMARVDFANAARLSDVDQYADALSPRLGRALVEGAASKRRAATGLLTALASPKNFISSKRRRVLDAPHRQPVIWPELARGVVQISRMTVDRRGFPPYTVASDRDPVPKNCWLTFEASTTVTPPFKVFWQVVNTGDEACHARDLRGGFDEGRVEPGGLTRRETTRYTGSHSIECFVVKDGYCVARSGPFLVNIA
jgi:Adenylyl/Guanylyl and SMODS C-terminal sensor domain